MNAMKLALNATPTASHWADCNKRIVQPALKLI
jgi:hypothetical protein